MLESMYNFPRFLCDGYYSKYGDGVLYGLEWENIDNKHSITPGALKYNGEIYFQAEKLIVEDSINMESLESGQEYYVYFKEASPQKMDIPSYDTCLKRKEKVNFNNVLSFISYRMYC